MRFTADGVSFAAEAIDLADESAVRCPRIPVEILESSGEFAVGALERV